MNMWKELESLESWISQTEEQKNKLSERILELLPKRFILGESFSRKLDDGTSLLLSCFYDEEYETVLVLIPGGTFSYGLSSDHEKLIKRLCTPQEWGMIHSLLDDAKPDKEMYIPPFLMSRYPVLSWVIEENINISNSIERPDFSNGNGPNPIYLTKDEINLFLEKTGYRMPYDWEWEFIAKGKNNELFISGNNIPSEKLLKDICHTSFGNSKKNNKVSNDYGIAGLAVATLTAMDKKNDMVAVRGGAAGFYPFQGPGQWPLLLTGLRMPLENMPGGVAGLRLCLDIPSH